MSHTLLYNEDKTEFSVRLPDDSEFEPENVSTDGTPQLLPDEETGEILLISFGMADLPLKPDTIYKVIECHTVVETVDFGDDDDDDGDDDDEDDDGDHDDGDDEPFEEEEEEEEEEEDKEKITE